MRYFTKIERLTQIFVILIVFLFVIPFSMAQDKDLSYEKMKEDIIQTWEDIFSSKVSFSDRQLFDQMIRIGPQTMDKLTQFGNKKLHTEILWGNHLWFSRFFKDFPLPEGYGSLDAYKNYQAT